MSEVLGVQDAHSVTFGFAQIFLTANIHCTNCYEILENILPTIKCIYCVYLRPNSEGFFLSYNNYLK